MAITGLGSTDGMSCGCGGARATSGFGLSPDGLGISPDGLGDASSSPILGGKITGSSWLDATLGAGLGYAFAPSKSSSSKGEEWDKDVRKFVYAAAGAAALGLLGVPGLIGAVALKIVSKAK